jgi:ABC-type transporter Mla maintaining outer membrane lipid asymmetry ATPase subunit MlaF
MDEAEFMMLKDGDVVFEGNVHELKDSKDHYIQSFLS